MIFISLYILFLLLFNIFTWSFAGRNFLFVSDNLLFDFAQQIPWFYGSIYSIFVIVFFFFYFFLSQKVRKGILKIKHVWKLIILTVLILLPSFPAFSYDIFNYMATAKVTFFYRENPYIVMPIELPNEPLLSFMHAANKVALYGPTWIASTFIPYVISMNDILRMIYTFKAFIALFYLGVCWLIWKLSGKNIYSLIFFALNPLVIIETLVSSHNDVVMLFFALLSFWLLREKKIPQSVLAFIFSILIKFSTLFLIPVYIYTIFLILRNKKVAWNRIWFYSTISMYIILFLSPIREEIYSWYLIWPLVFVSLIPNQKLLKNITVAFSFGLLFRVVPFLYTLNWGGVTPLVKKIVTFTPPSLTAIYYAIRKKI